MKKILFILIITLASLNAKPCMTDIYYGNGVWNDRDDAIENQIALRTFMLLKANIRLDIQKEETEYTFQYIHNPSYGVIDDLIETFWQLYQSEQISYPYFYNQSVMLSVATGNITKNEIWDKINAIVSDYNNDIVTMLHKYQEESFDKEHNVLLVAHSQGNLFGNKMYTFLTDKQKQKFRMISIATPASYVKVPEQISPYVTVVGDPVINIIPNALDGNVDGIGHEFVSTYLVGSINAPRKIALYVKSAYDDLMQTTSCNQYEYYVWIGYYCPSRSSQELIVDIYGRPTNVPYPYTKQLVTFDTRERMPQDINGNCTVQGDDVWSWWSEYDKNGCYAYNIDDTASRNHTLDYVAAQTYNNGVLCTQYKMPPETTETLRSLLSTSN